MPDVGPSLEALVALMDRLRGPDGCPWDREQTLASLKTYLIEEAYEAADAMTRGDWGDIREELGDLLFQIVFVARLAKEAGVFDLADVADGIRRKMTARHPHVFGDSVADDAERVARQWEEIKRGEAKESGKSLLGGVPLSLPALLKAHRMTERAAGLGFDWRETADVLEKLDEEIAEWKAELGSFEPGARARAREELGDMLFVMANVARKLGFDAEDALQHANEKFRKRFEALGALVDASGRSFGESTLEELDELWDVVKSRESEA